MGQTQRKNQSVQQKTQPMVSTGGDLPVILTVVANWLMGDRVLAFAGLYPYEFAYITQGKGTVRKASLRESGQTDFRKEIVTILTTLPSAYNILAELKAEMHLEESNAGIAFIRQALATGMPGEETKGGGPMESTDANEFRAIYVIVKKGFAENVISAGERAGTRGATVFAARGEAREGKIPGLLISDDKEVILVITTAEKAQRFLSEIREDTQIMTRGEARLFVTEIIDTVGISFF